MTTYTIAFKGVLWACLPDGDDITQAVLDTAKAGHIPPPEEYEIITGLTLTNEKPDNEKTIYYVGSLLGWPTDKNGNAFKYAVKPYEGA